MRLSILFLTLSLFYFSKLFGSDGTSAKNKYEYSKIIDIPDLSFVGKVYSGLDILEQMDFKPLRNKSIAILTNQSAVNRNNQHLLDILTRYPDIAEQLGQERLLQIESIVDAFEYLWKQPKSGWTFEVDVRTATEPW